MSEDGKTTPEEKSSPSSKVCFVIYINIFVCLIFQLESMSQEELIKFLKTQIVIKKKLEARISELQTSNVSLCQTEEVNSAI
jgi:hypothetical protein